MTKRKKAPADVPRRWTTNDGRFAYTVEVDASEVRYSKVCLNFWDREIGQAAYEELEEHVPLVAFEQDSRLADLIRTSLSPATLDEVVAELLLRRSRATSD